MTTNEIETRFDDMFTVHDPYPLLDEWMAQAKAAEPGEHDAMSLASVDRDGMPNVRMVLAKEIDARGIVFYTNFNSTKGHEFEANPKAALCFYWKSLSRQVRARGRIEQVSMEQADRYFASRPRDAQIGALASDQSQLLASREILELKLKACTEKYHGRDVPRPAHWSGFRLVPDVFEFWRQRPFRLHDRLIFERSGEAQWTRTRLYP